MKIRYLGNGQVKIEGRLKVRRRGDVIDSSDVPADAFAYLASRPDFEAVAVEGSEAPPSALPLDIGE